MINQPVNNTITQCSLVSKLRSI